MQYWQYNENNKSIGSTNSEEENQIFSQEIPSKQGLKCLPNLGDIFVNNVATRDWLPSMETKFKERHNNLNLFAYMRFENSTK